MKSLNYNLFLYGLLGISVALWFIIAHFTGTQIRTFLDAIKILPTVVTCDLLIIAFFYKWAWKWPIFQGWLVPFPNLSGTWEGHILTTWVNPETGSCPGEIPAMLTIRQTFQKVSCILRTMEMTSYSFSEEFILTKTTKSSTCHIYIAASPCIPYHRGTLNIMEPLLLKSLDNR